MSQRWQNHDELSIQPIFIQGGVPVQPGQFVQPVFIQAPVGSLHPGQPVNNQDMPRQHAVTGQQPLQNSDGRPVQQPQRPVALGLDLSIDMDFLKSPLCFIRLAEFVSIFPRLMYVCLPLSVFNSLFDVRCLIESLVVFSYTRTALFGKCFVLLWCKNSLWY